MIWLWLIWYEVMRDDMIAYELRWNEMWCDIICDEKNNMNKSTSRLSYLSHSNSATIVSNTSSDWGPFVSSFDGTMLNVSYSMRCHIISHYIISQHIVYIIDIISSYNILQGIYKILDSLASSCVELWCWNRFLRYINIHYSNNQQSTSNNQQSTINNNQSTINNQQSTINNNQSTINNQQSTINNQQSTIINNQQSTINNQQSTINNQQSTISNQQSTINNQQSTRDIHLRRFINIIIHMSASKYWISKQHWQCISIFLWCRVQTFLLLDFASPLGLRRFCHGWWAIKLYDVYVQCMMYMMYMMCMMY